ncbi:MAG: hypothetical protein MUC36_28225 [Planctomycetes bacterium]|jgi:hypothetical protein|nr:hypothetical protein [Planctomycetota bacterium]
MSRPVLPEGWFYPTADEAAALLQELLRELPPGHLLDDVRVETFAHRRGATDDVLFRHLDTTDRVTVIHLTWLGRTEIHLDHPGVEFDGTLADFVAEEERRWGLKRPLV